jgi:hypothetical protein
VAQNAATVDFPASSSMSNLSNQTSFSTFPGSHAVSGSATVKPPNQPQTVAPGQQKSQEQMGGKKKRKKSKGKRKHQVESDEEYDNDDGDDDNEPEEWEVEQIVGYRKGKVIYYFSMVLIDPELTDK